MGKKIGLFTDIHGSWENLEAIVNTFKSQKASSCLFLGDALYDTMAQNTLYDAQMSSTMIDQLREDSDLRKDFLEGALDKQQLEALAARKKKAQKISSGVAASEYSAMKDAMKGIGLKVLGGNWDYVKEMQEAFGEDLVDTAESELDGIKFAGFSGGGSPTNKSVGELSFADNRRDDDKRSTEWYKFLLTEDLDVSFLASHLPFTDGEGVAKESGVERLKDALLKRVEHGKKVPSVVINGHRHGEGEVLYNEELKLFTVNPGSCASAYNENKFPTFMTAELGDDKQIARVQKYEIRAALEGKREVVLASEFELDHKNKKVNEKKIGSTVISENISAKPERSVSNDPNYAKLQKGMSLDYKGLNAEQKDEHMKKNVAVMFNITEERQQEIDAACKEAASTFAKTKDLQEAVSLLTDKFNAMAAESFGASFDEVPDIFRQFRADTLMRLAFGITSGDIAYTLSKKEPADASEFYESGKALAKQGANTLSKIYQHQLFRNLEADDYREMAELYIPKNFKQSNGARMSDEEARGFWIDTYQKGLLTQEAMKEYSEFYEVNKSYKKKPMAKEEIASICGFKLKEKEAKDKKQMPQQAAQQEQEKQDKSQQQNPFQITEENGEKYVKMPLSLLEGMQGMQGGEQAQDTGEAPGQMQLDDNAPDENYIPMPQAKAA